MKMRYFDSEKLAHEADIPPDKLEKLRQLIRRDFPKDDMMYELHLLRACMAIKSGVSTIEQALQSEETSQR
jgi:hypothetical protein